MVLERDAPHEREPLGVRVAAQGAEPGRERLQPAREQAVVGELGALLGHARRGAAGQQRTAQPGAQLAAVHGKRLVGQRPARSAT
jgi:hypothetical protein